MACPRIDASVLCQARCRRWAKGPSFSSERMRLGRIEQEDYLHAKEQREDLKTSPVPFAALLAGLADPESQVRLQTLHVRRRVRVESREEGKCRKAGFPAGFFQSSNEASVASLGRTRFLYQGVVPKSVASVSYLETEQAERRCTTVVRITT